MFFYALFIFFCPTGNSASKTATIVQDICITGFNAAATTGALKNGYDERQIAGVSEAFLQAPIRQWLTAHQWQAGYNLWQESRRCRSLFGANANSICEQNTIPQPSADECQGAVDGYEFLVMHRYLLQTMRTLWPQLEDPFTGWSQFPQAEDYPPFLQPRFYPWPNGVLNNVPNIGGGGETNGHGAAVLPDENTADLQQQLLSRWKTEGELGQWLQCGATFNGLGIDGLYPALITNAIPVGDRLGHQTIYPMDLYLFWKTHGWIDQVWEDYRRALGKSPEDPELQAALIQQCRIHHFWAEKSSSLPAGRLLQASDDPLYSNGELNPHYAGKLIRLMGEVVEIRQGLNNKSFIKIDARLVGVKPIWVSSFAPIAEGMVKLGATYEFIGTVAEVDRLDTSGQLRKFLQSPTLLLIKSLQSPK